LSSKARALRITFSGAFYHVTIRANERKAVFKSKRDREKFLEYLESATQRYDALIHTSCIPILITISYEQLNAAIQRITFIIGANSDNVFAKTFANNFGANAFEY
jgi:REP element-mobilizing transposase RayT